MKIGLHLPDRIKALSLQITGSKSETNRALLLQALFQGISVKNISESDDSEAMGKALAGNDEVVDIHHAGTAMRFLTAYYAVQQGRETVLTGSPRMKERPIGVLVDALRSLGADIQYLENEGYPPLKIKGNKITADNVTVKANVSSQFITALLLIAAELQNGLYITLEGEITSRPYLEMTLTLLSEIGVMTEFKDNCISVAPVTHNLQPITIIIESDWSSASYFYSIIALSPVGTSVNLSSYKQNSLQGDSALSEIYKSMGVSTVFEENTITLTRIDYQLSTVNRQLNNTPDIAQTVAVTCFGLGVGCHLTGLHTLKIKETDRLEALKTELEKLGAKITVTDDSLTLEASLHINPDVAIDTYNDHRMAMAFAPLAIKAPIIINNAEVVTKSYPLFWDDLRQLGFNTITL